MYPVLQKTTASLTTMVFALTFLASGCKSGSNAQTASSAATAPQDQPAQNQPALSVDDLVAPIALYPDQLLGQVLTASTNPQEVLDVGNWLLQNQNLQGNALANAAKQAGFSVSSQYLVLFPQVVDNMCQEMDWTRQLGEAFKADQKSVMDAVQRKRQQAQQVGNLQSSPQMAVATKTDNGQQYVEIKPADPKVVYVPQYNPVTIYNTQAAPAPAPAPAATTTTTTTTESKSGVSTGTAVAIGLLSFGVGMAVGSAISNNNNYYPYPAWGYGGMYYGGRPYYPPPYRPPVYPGYRPVYGYNPPPNYHWNQYNRNVNVNVNNNYYNKFNNNNINSNNRPSTLPANNNRPGGNNNGYLGANNNNRPNQGQGNRPTTYQGARPSETPGQKPGASMANVNPGNRNPGSQMASNRPNNAGNAGNAGNRPANLGASNPGGNGAANTRDINRPNNGGGAGGMNRPNSSPSPANGKQPMNRGGDRGYASNSPGPAARPSAPATRPTPGAQPAARPAPAASPAPASGGGGGGAFSGGSGKADRAASNRGHASMGAGHAGGGGARRSR
jgi:hypothetical protein